MKSLILWLVLYFGGIIRGLVHPIYPLLSYLTFYYAPPHVNSWGNPLPDLRYSLMAAAAVTASLVIQNANLERLKADRNPALPWLIASGLNTVLVTTWALQKARSWIWSLAYLKLIVIYMLIPAAIRTPAQFDMFAAAHVAGATYWGYKAWDDPERNAGRLEAVGGPDSQNDNSAAGHLLTVIPFAALFVLTSKRRSHQFAAAFGGAFIVNVFILCNSRGATLGLIASGMAAIVLAGRGKRKKLIAVGLAAGLVVLYLADRRFIDRQQTTANPQDGSALSRLEMWAAGVRMVKDHPLGSGGRAFHILSPRYIPDLVERAQSEERAAHNSYVQLATDWGVQGFVLFAIFVFMTFRMLHKIRRRAGPDSWFHWRSLAIEVGLVGLLVAAFFSSKLYHEAIWWMCALTFALYRIQATKLAEQEAPAPAVVVPVRTFAPAARQREAPAR